MSFDSLRGAKLSSPKSDNVYIISDYFTVITGSEEPPLIYRWSDLQSVIVNEQGFTAFAKGAVYTINNSYFTEREEYLRVCAIVETQAGKAGVLNLTKTQLLPPKNLFSSTNLLYNTISARGEYNIKEIKNSSLYLLIGRISRLLWGVGILGGIVSLILLQFFVGFKETNWWYFLIGAFFLAVGAVAIVYIFLLIISKLHYSRMLNAYNRKKDQLIFLINGDGFGVIEADVYTGGDIIKWNMTDTYIETSNMFVIIRNKNPLVWLPKNLFSKNQVKDIGNLIGLKLEQR